MQETQEILEALRIADVFLALLDRESGKLSVVALLATDINGVPAGDGQQGHEGFFKVIDGETDPLQFVKIPLPAIAGRQVHMEAAAFVSLNPIALGLEMGKQVFDLSTPIPLSIECQDGGCDLERVLMR